MNNGYTTITINDEVIGLKFAIPANREFFSNLDADKWLSQGELNEIGFAHLLFHAYENNCLIKDELPVYKLGYFIQYMDEVCVDEEVQKEFQKVIAVYEESKYTKKYLEQIEAATKKMQDDMNEDLPGKKK